MSRKTHLNLVAFAAAAVQAAAAAPPPAQAAPAAGGQTASAPAKAAQTQSAQTQSAAARATGKPTSDAPATTQAQGTAWAVRQAAAPAAGAAAAAAPAAVIKVTPHGDLIETLRVSGHFTTFLKAVEATNLTGVLKNNQNLTVFAPTDAAFAALPPGRLDQLMADKAQLQKVLTHHIINARVDSSKIKGAKGPVPSVSGEPIELDGSGAVLKADNADIIQPDVMASNGVLQVVDQVLAPGAPAAAASAQPAAASVPAAPAQLPPSPAQAGATRKR